MEKDPKRVVDPSGEGKGGSVADEKREQKKSMERSPVPGSASPNGSGVWRQKEKKRATEGEQPSMKRVALNDSRLPVTHKINILVVGNAGVGKTTYVKRCTGESFSSAAVPTVGVDFSQFAIADPVWPDRELLSICIWDVAGAERFDSITSGYFRNLAGIIFVCDLTDRDSLFSIIWRWLPTTIHGLRERGNVTMSATGVVGIDIEEQRALKNHGQELRQRREKERQGVAMPLPDPGDQKEKDTRMVELTKRACAEFKAFRVPSVLVASKLDRVTAEKDDRDFSNRAFSIEEGMAVAEKLGIPYVECSSKTDTSEAMCGPLAHIVHFLSRSPELYREFKLSEAAIRSQLDSRTSGKPSAAQLSVNTNGKGSDGSASANGGGGCCS